MTSPEEARDAFHKGICPHCGGQLITRVKFAIIQQHGQIPDGPAEGIREEHFFGYFSPLPTETVESIYCKACRTRFQPEEQQ